MIVSVTTLKDTVANVRKFVSRNLAGGVDHVVIYLDAELPDVEEYLSAHPDVTCIPAYGDWWDDRPQNLNERQGTNAGMLSRLLDGYPWAEWLVHLDGDEVAELDLPALASLDRSCDVVRLAPLEAVAQLHPEADPVLFKRLLDDDELALLHALGLLSRATNRRYFRGHVAGKLVVRPSRDLALAIHKAWRTDLTEIAPLDDGRQRVLHYESPNGEEFVRKWLALLSSGTGVRQRGTREPVARSILALLDLGLSETDTAHFLEEIYQRYAVDDVDALQRLGLLVHLDPDAPRPPREPFPEAAKEDLAALVERARPLRKKQFRPVHPGPRVLQTVDRVHRDLGR